MIMRMKRFGLVFSLLIPLLAMSSGKRDYALREILELGIRNNAVLSSYRQEIDARKAAFEASQRFANPGVEWESGRAVSYDKLISKDTQGFAFNQTVENPFARHYRLKAIEKDWRSAEDFYHYAVLDVTFEIKKLVFAILALENKEKLAQKNFESMTETHRIIEKRASLGEVKELEAIKLQVEKLRANNEWNKISTEIRLAKEKLNTLLANALPSDFRVVGELTYRPLELNEESLVGRTLLTYPMIRKKEKELEAAQAQLQYSKWQRLPDFSLSGFIRNDLHGRDKGIGLSLDVPLWNFKGAEIREAEYLVRKKEDELKALRLETASEVRAKLNELRLSEQTLALFLGGLLNQAEQSLKISEASYRQGEISLIDYLDSQRTYYAILKDYEDSLFAWNVNKAALEKAIGEDLQ